MSEQSSAVLYQGIPFPYQVLKLSTPYAGHSKNLWIINQRAYHEFGNGRVGWVTSARWAREKYKRERDIEMVTYDKVPKHVRHLYESNELANYTMRDELA